MGCLKMLTIRLILTNPAVKAVLNSATVLNLMFRWVELC